MSLIEFKDLPNTDTPINANDLNHNFNEINNKNIGTLTKGISGKTTATITSSSGYGTVLIVSSQFVCVIQLSNTELYIKDIYGTHDTMSASISNNVVSITGLYNWDHYIFIGSSHITNIE